MRNSSSSPAAPTSVDDYLARLDPVQRAALETLRAQIHAAMPGAEECISYQLAAFRLHGRVMVWMGATRSHCAFYPGAVVQAHAAELSDYETSKGTIRFQPDAPLPPALVARLVRARIAQQERLAGAATERAARKKAAKPAPASKRGARSAKRSARRPTKRHTKRPTKRGR